MKNIKSFVVKLARRIAERFGYAAQAPDEIGGVKGFLGRSIDIPTPCGEIPKAVGMPSLDLKFSDGVHLMSMKVWTEGQSNCNHCYHDVRPLNSHISAIKSSSGDVSHRDSVCCRCTHKMCMSSWQEA